MQFDAVSLKVCNVGEADINGQFTFGFFLNESAKEVELCLMVLTVFKGDDGFA
ncbi:MAG: hypothetical protein QGG64_06745 [Candidatus Latescibacteria bacterium]|nr:hypothetical protein [Candidatus Latescibacterota bacterium]